MLEFLLQLDRDLFLFLNGLHATWLDPIMFFLTRRLAWIPLYLFLMWLCIRTFGWRTLLLLLFFTLLITLSDQTTNVFKSYFQRPRPSKDESLEGLVQLVNGYRGGGKFGFVSAHSANSFALAVFVIRLMSKKHRFLIPLMLSYAVLNAYTRVYLGVHYPADILVGGLVGAIIGYFVFELWKLADQRIYFNRLQQAK
jgi:undecaprenyl-diphosphatase